MERKRWKLFHRILGVSVLFVCLFLLILCLFLVQASEKLPKHLDWAFPWQQGFWLVPPPPLHYGLHPDDFGLSVKLQSGRGKRGDYKPNSLSVKGKDWDDRFFHAVLVLHRKPFTNLLSLC